KKLMNCATIHKIFFSASYETKLSNSRPKVVTKRINKEFPQFEEETELTPELIETLSEEDQEAADQINRRTEFQVTAIDTDFELM
ncbi:MAG: hypothetical protein K2L17_07640, partial [Muribaculaceae bacterium]|nr:hypothetical protein [Muribaculaceae bacterium]